MGALIQVFHLKRGIHLNNLAFFSTTLSPEYFDLNASPCVSTIPLLSLIFHHQSHVTFSRSLTIIEDCRWIAACVLKNRRWCVNCLKRFQLLHLACCLSLFCFSTKMLPLLRFHRAGSVTNRP